MFITCPKCSAKYKIPSKISLKSGQKVQCSACQNIFEFVPDKEEERDDKISLLPPEDAVLSVHTRTERVVFSTQENKKPPIKNDSLSLPEVFRPVQNQNKQNSIPYFWMILSFILLVSLVFMGWMWRDLLSTGVVMPPVQTNIQRLPPKRISKPAVPKVSAPSSEDIPLMFEEPENLPPTEPIPSEVVPDLAIQSVRFRKSPEANAILVEGTLKNNSEQTVSMPTKIYALGYGTEGRLLFEQEIYLSEGLLPPRAEQTFFGSYSPITEEVQWVDVVLKK